MQGQLLIRILAIPGLCILHQGGEYVGRRYRGLERLSWFVGGLGPELTFDARLAGDHEDLTHFAGANGVTDDREVFFRGLAPEGNPQQHQHHHRGR